jgi:hypothetical protein
MIICESFVVGSFEDYRKTTLRKLVLVLELENDIILILPVYLSICTT